MTERRKTNQSSDRSTKPMIKTEPSLAPAFGRSSVTARTINPRLREIYADLERNRDHRTRVMRETIQIAREAVAPVRNVG